VSCDRKRLVQKTSCLISRINLSGGGNNTSSTLAVDSTNGSVRLYVTGAGGSSSPSVDFSGQAGIKHIRRNSKTGNHEQGLAADLALLGNASDSDNSNDQLVNLAGEATETGLWAYSPDGTVGIKGGNNNDPLYCDSITGSCFGGEIVGDVWAKSWGARRISTAPAPARPQRNWWCHPTWARNCSTALDPAMPWASTTTSHWGQPVEQFHSVSAGLA